jgi:hypothetical protein
MNRTLNILKIYKWHYEDIEECLIESKHKNYIAFAMCISNDLEYDTEIGYDIDKQTWYCEVIIYNKNID